MRYKMKYSEYSKYYSSIINKSRYGFDKRSKYFLKYLEKTSNEKILKLPYDFELFRTQRGHVEIEDNFQITISPYNKERMLPKAEKIKNGRVNPTGIPVLYLSDDYLTAIAEIRPWLQETISIANFRTTRELSLIDVSKYRKISRIFIKEPKDPMIIKDKIWSDVGHAFSQPVTIDDQEIAYIPTQVISEYFKMLGFDGICYKSFLGKGKNYALFDLESVEIKYGFVVEVNEITINTEKICNPIRIL